MAINTFDKIAIRADLEAELKGARTDYAGAAYGSAGAAIRGGDSKVLTAANNNAQSLNDAVQAQVDEAQSQIDDFAEQYEALLSTHVVSIEGEWDATKAYNQFSVVTDANGNSYTAKVDVSAGTPLTDTDYWALTADYNAQMEQLRQLVEEYVDVVEQWDEELQAEITNIEKTHSYPTVAAMKNGKNLTAGTICHTNGFHASGDGGAAWYLISDTGTANEMDVIACGDLFANLILTEDYITPEMIGCPYDGVTDATDYIQYLVDNYIKIQFLFIQDHSYLVTDTITVDKPRIVLYGDGMGNQADAGAGAIYYENPNATSSNHPALFNVHHEGQTYENLNISLNRYATGFYAKCYDNNNDEVADIDLAVKNCTIKGGYCVFDVTGRGCAILSNSFASFENLVILNWNQNAETSPIANPEGYGQRAIRIENNRLHSFRGTVVNVLSGQCYGLRFTDNVIDHGRGRVFYVTDGANGWVISGNVFNNCIGYDFSTDNGKIIFFFNCVSKTIMNCIISNNTFYTKTGGYITYDALGQVVHNYPFNFIRMFGIVINTSIVNNVFYDCDNEIITFKFEEGSENIIVSNNVAKQSTYGLIGLYSGIAHRLAIIGNIITTDKVANNTILRAFPSGLVATLTSSKVIGNVINNNRDYLASNVTADSTSVVEPWS